MKETFLDIQYVNIYGYSKVNNKMKPQQLQVRKHKNINE